MEDGTRPRAWEECGVLLLIAEVLSLATARYDRITKGLRYQRSSVAEYWIVDLDARVIERWTPWDSRPEILDERIEWRPAGALDPRLVDLTEYFREAWGEA